MTCRLRARSSTNFVRRGILSPVARHLQHDGEDRLQDGIAQVWAMYRRHAEKGEELEPAILVHACRLKARDLGRSVANDGSPEAPRCPGPRNQAAGRVALVHLDGLDNYQRDQTVGMAQPLCANPARKMTSKIEFGDWVGSLPARDQALLRLRALGHTWQETGEAVGLPLKSAYDRGHELGKVLQERMAEPG